MTDYRYGLAAALAGLTFSAAALAGPPSYTITPLGLPAERCGEYFPLPSGINASGEVTGIYCRAGLVRGFRWHRGELSTSGSRPGFRTTPPPSSCPPASTLGAT
jgi:hypothetical protein